ELRTEPDASVAGDPLKSGIPRRADLFDASRLQAYAKLDGVDQAAPALQRRAPGLWAMTYSIEAGHGGSSLTLGVRFDGVDVVAPRTVPIATDIWTAEYPTHVRGGCVMARGGRDGFALGVAAVVLVVVRRARRRAAGSGQRAAGSPIVARSGTLK